MFDLIVVGGGIGGLATAALAQSSGLKVALFESHTRLGGCAGYFDRGPYVFDAGATALMGVEPVEPIGRLVADLGMEFESVATSSYAVYLPDRNLQIVPEVEPFEAEIRRAFPEATDAILDFWKFQAAVGSTLFQVASRELPMPPRTIGEMLTIARGLRLRGIAAASTSLVTTHDVLRLFGLDTIQPFRKLIDMLLQDTAQAGAETVPFANASACLHAYRAGLRRPKGGMMGFAEGLGARFEAIGGVLRRGSIVDRVEPDPSGGFRVKARRGIPVHTRHVAFNLPIDLAARLLGRDLAGTLGARQRGSRAVWSAFTAYLAIDRAAIPDDAALFHHVLMDYDRPTCEGNNVLISLSTPGDVSYGPNSVRVATLSTHVRPSDWDGLDPVAHESAKAAMGDRMLGALGRALPAARESLVHAEFATPRSFGRYTRRTGGAVGGAPTSRRNSNLLAVGVDVLGPGLSVVGDSVFPGQGTMAVVLSARRALGRITRELGGSPGRPASPSREERFSCSTP